ncbi:RagB/SusD family nutrient uptake outer membrane protein [Arcticibacterium luteifluviistationis]|uniref:RagB/SusD family nutrient uptake outer membrane protein n=1 Tax=Arcticibacterium luteifluviistationis TaxID=1784714 RepID=A0A2Z4GB56_9BACT|nr:RagB/SusD family nutrient uptake outer membrane protein [Arcticibacterium luteifluviistationis]AWV98519.1 RagB/SusD family nutrient uptake outer membrane protein [Arcticibacterium luteifluviistationis]
MKNIINRLTIFILCLLFTTACEDDFLKEVPLDRFSPENLLTNEAGFDAAVVALYEGARKEHIIASNNFEYMTLGTDQTQWGRNDSRGNKDYSLLNSNLSAAIIYWDWAYKQMIVRSNLILENIDNPDLVISDEARENIKGQALFFRAYTYNFLANIYGGVPIVEDRITEPKFDFVRNSRAEVLSFSAKDLEAATLLLPMEVNDGRIPQAAAFHLLSEVYISLGMETNDATMYDKSISAASKVISKEAGDYEIMTNRFGAAATRPGDVFSDIFADGQINRSSGNKEVLWAWQFEPTTLGGGFSASTANNSIRYWSPEYGRIQTPNDILNIDVDSLGRGIGVNSPTNYAKYEVWALDPEDMRNSHFNIRRTFYYNNPADTEYYGKPVLTKVGADGNLFVTKNDGTLTTITLDTLRQYYPYFRKIEGPSMNGDILSGNTSKDFSRMRVAETYLLRGEAYFRKGDLANAAKDINVVRARAEASQISSSDVTEDFILDERTRELIVEEPRLRTLIRMGRLVDRVRKYNSAPSVPNGPSSGETIQDFNRFWPIPQKVIDANTGAALEQNPGY